MATAHQSSLQNDAASDPRWLLVRRIAASEHFRTSPRLCDFLLHICDCVIREELSDLTEQQIGIKVFGRPPGYNASEDNIVRSHARMLRLKLEAYFASEGRSEDYVIEVPRGHYLPVFRNRVARSGVAEADLDKSKLDKSKIEQPAQLAGMPITDAETTQTFRIPRWGLLSVAAAVLAAGLIAAVWFSPARPITPSGPLETFWRPFFAAEPLVIYSNAAFVRDEMQGLLQLPRDAKSDQPIIDDYTGIGEVAGVLQLTRLFDAHRAAFILKRSRLVTWDEARTRNLIFVGSTGENTALRDLPETTEFTFALPSESPQGLTGVLNHHPKAGEQTLYLRPDRRPLQSDFAIVALLPGLQSGHRILVLSGLTTYGTQAAVEYVTRSDAVAELLRPVPSSKGQIQSFEAVLETTIRGGVPLQTKLIAIHTR